MKIEFGDKPEIYNEFLDIMKNFKVIKTRRATNMNGKGAFCVLVRCPSASKGNNAFPARFMMLPAHDPKEQAYMRHMSGNIGTAM